jgi:hypothetical protein
MKKIVLKLFIIPLLAMLIVACEEESPKSDTDPQDVDQESNKEQQALITNDNRVSMVPTPNELFDIIKEVNVSYDEQVLNNPDNIDNYTDKKSQSLNFGIYTADLAFAASFGNPTESAKYFTVIKDMGDRLNINNALDQTVFDQIDKSIQGNNNNELFKLSNDTYYDAYTYLKENERGPSLALIVLGGWVESLYIMTQLGKYEEGSVLVSRIIDQKYTLENLYDFMQEYESDIDVMEMMATLQPIDEVFLNLEELLGDEFSNTNEKDVNLMDGGSDFSMTEDQYNHLKNAVNELRTKIVESDF